MEFESNEDESDLDSLHASPASMALPHRKTAADVDDRIAFEAYQANVLDGKPLGALLLIPCAFGAFAVGSELAANNLHGAAAALWWHLAFWLASIEATKRPIPAVVLAMSAALAPLVYEVDPIVRM